MRDCNTVIYAIVIVREGVGMGGEDCEVLIDFLLTTCLCVVGGVFICLALFAVFHCSERASDEKRAVKACCVFVFSVVISLIYEIIWLGKWASSVHGTWKTLTVISFTVLVIRMVIVHLECGRGKRMVLIGTTVQFVIYVLGFLLFQLG
jgi:cytochrome bd-type quinol oxidase subunit 2